MNPEQNKKSSQETLTRRQKLLRRVAAPLAAVAALGALHNGISEDKSPKPDEVTFAEVTNTVHVSTEFGGAESDWGHGTATSLIEEAVDKGVDRTEFDLDLDGESDISQQEAQEIISQVPTYNKANELLEKAGYNEVVPDKGDILKATIAVTTDTDKNVTYEVVDAEIKDIPNNQE